MHWYTRRTPWPPWLRAWAGQSASHGAACTAATSRTADCRRQLVQRAADSPTRPVNCMRRRCRQRKGPVTPFLGAIQAHTVHPPHTTPSSSCGCGYTRVFNVRAAAHTQSSLSQQRGSKAIARSLTSEMCVTRTMSRFCVRHDDITSSPDGFEPSHTFVYTRGR